MFRNHTSPKILGYGLALGLFGAVANYIYNKYATPPNPALPENKLTPLLEKLYTPSVTEVERAFVIPAGKLKSVRQYARIIPEFKIDTDFQVRGEFHERATIDEDFFNTFLNNKALQNQVDGIGLNDEVTVLQLYGDIIADFELIQIELEKFLTSAPISRIVLGFYEDSSLIPNNHDRRIFYYKELWMVKNIKPDDHKRRSNLLLWGINDSEPDEVSVVRSKLVEKHMSYVFYSVWRERGYPHSRNIYDLEVSTSIIGFNKLVKAKLAAIEDNQQSVTTPKIR